MFMETDNKYIQVGILSFDASDLQDSWAGSPEKLALLLYHNSGSKQTIMHIIKKNVIKFYSGTYQCEIIMLSSNTH